MPALNCSTIHYVSLPSNCITSVKRQSWPHSVCQHMPWSLFLGLSRNRRPVTLTIRRSHMKTVSDVFITNLTVADYLVYLVNVPVVTTLGNWGIGRSVKFMCKLLSSFGRMCRCLRVSNRLSYTGGPTPNFITCICMLHWSGFRLRLLASRCCYFPI